MPDNNGIPIEKRAAGAAAGMALTIAAGNSSASLDKFAAWVLVGFGAGLALIISHLKDIADFIPMVCVISTGYQFLIATVLCLAQRYIAMVVGCGAAGMRDGAVIGEKFRTMDLSEFILQIKVGVPWPIRFIANGLLDAVAQGDLTASGRLLLRLTLLQGLLVTAEIIILLVALSRIFGAIKT